MKYNNKFILRPAANIIILRPAAKITISFFILLFCFTPLNTSASDYLVDLVSENYRELKTGDADGPKIYHTIQVDTSIGTKVLMLTGKDHEYRKWLRQYLSRYSRLIVTVPDETEPDFQTSKLVAINVNSIHPVSGSSWKEDPTIIPLPPPEEFTGEKHILIVDDDPEKRVLIEMVVKDLGFPVTLASNAYDGLAIFKNQPDKFRLVIADAASSRRFKRSEQFKTPYDLNSFDGLNRQNEKMTSNEMESYNEMESSDHIYSSGQLSTTSLIRHIIETSPGIPIIIGTDYREEQITAMFMDFFSGFSHITIKPLVLQELSKTILQVLEKNV
ncbi:response regulator [Desulfamplus magnetovallimortis]|nr:hypothetical protein [Desulfamplus magnetovallimortis]